MTVFGKILIMMFRYVIPMVFFILSIHLACFQLTPKVLCYLFLYVGVRGAIS